MAPRDVAPSFDCAQDGREPVERPGSDVESQWFDVRTAAKYLCMTRHAIYQGFYLILRPEDRAAGGPDPARWIDPLMHHLGVAYRITLLRAAAFHGASHQAAQVFQMIVPKQLRSIAIDRQRIQFVYQAPQAFATVNQPPWLGELKTDAGFAKVAGIELSLLDAVRYFHQAAGLNGAAQPLPTRTPLRVGSVICSSTSNTRARPRACVHSPGKRSRSSRSTRQCGSWRASRAAPRCPKRRPGS